MASPWVARVKIAGRKLKMIQDKPRMVEELLKDSSSMGSGGQGRRKKKSKGYEDDYVSKKDTATVPQQQRQKACWVF